MKAENEDERSLDLNVSIESKDEFVLMALGGLLNLYLNQEKLYHVRSYGYREKKEVFQ